MFNEMPVPVLLSDKERMALRVLANCVDEQIDMDQLTSARMNAARIVAFLNGKIDGLSREDARAPFNLDQGTPTVGTLDEIMAESKTFSPFFRLILWDSDSDDEFGTIWSVRDIAEGASKAELVEARSDELNKATRWTWERMVYDPKVRDNRLLDSEDHRIDPQR